MRVSLIFLLVAAVYTQTITTTAVDLGNCVVRKSYTDSACTQGGSYVNNYTCIYRERDTVF